MILDSLVLLITIIVGGCYEPKTFQEEVIVFVVIGFGLVFEAIRFSCWSKREQRKAERDNKRIYREIAEREFRKYGTF